MKTKKVAGTSFEIALSKFCGDDCIITEITRQDTELRKRLGYRGKQNCKAQKWPGIAALTREKFSRHMNSGEIQSRVPEEIWDAYKKITIFKNPFDQIVSQYFWLGRESTGYTFDRFAFIRAKLLIENIGIAPLYGPSQLDHNIKYVNLEHELKTVGLGDVYDVMQTVRAKGKYRPRFSIDLDRFYRISKLQFRLFLNYVPRRSNISGMSHRKLVANVIFGATAKNDVWLMSTL